MSGTVNATKVKEALREKGHTITFREMTKLNLLKGHQVTGNSDIPGSLEEVVATVIEQLPADMGDQASGQTLSEPVSETVSVTEPEQDEPSSEVEAASTKKPRSRKTKSLPEDSVGALITQFEGEGLSGLDLKLVVAWMPSIKGKATAINMSRRLTQPQLESLEGILKSLVMVQTVLKHDQDQLEGWIVPQAASLIGQEVYTYEGICGHSTQIHKRMVLDRLNNANSKVPPFFRLCAECRATRVALLNTVPGAAQADSVCSVCHDPTFNTGANGLAKSRADIWENLLSGVIGVLNLPLRLRPEHLDSSGKHQQLIRNREEFDLWVENYRINVGFAISAHPDLGAELKSRMEGEIEAKRLELGLPKEGTKK